MCVHLLECGLEAEPQDGGSGDMGHSGADCDFHIEFSFLSHTQLQAESALLLRLSVSLGYINRDAVPRVGRGERDDRSGGAQGDRVTQETFESTTSVQSPEKEPQRAP